MLAEEAAKMILLFDFYGGLLPVKQQEIVTMYYGENLSLSEIGESLSISRQGVHDALRKATKALLEYDSKLGLLRKYQSAELTLNAINDEIDKLTIYVEKADKENGKYAHSLDNGQPGTKLCIDKEILTESIEFIRASLQHIEI